METKKYSLALEGKTLEVELTNWAEQANGSVIVRLGDTMVLATAVMSSHPREGEGDFFPLTVDYEEKFYAAGKILGSRFVRRETRPSEEAILISRAIDRSIRPRFDLRIRNEVHVVVTVLSIDDENDPDVPAILASSLAISLSDIPWQGPIAAVRIGEKDGKFLLNPINTERLTSGMDILASGNKEKINMLEASASEIPEEKFVEAVEWGLKYIKELVLFQEKIVTENGREKTEVKIFETPPEMHKFFEEEFGKRLEEAIYARPRKLMREKTHLLKEEWFLRAKEKYPDLFQKTIANSIFEEAIDALVHRKIIETGERPDGRKPDEIRELKLQVGLLPRVHGSGLFMRGETHVLSTLTLGAPGEELIVEGMAVRTKKRFLHHYNFPPFSTGEIKPMRGPGRREIGHGALAGKALSPLIPSKDEFPYTIRIVSEALSSNGSTSMASVCASSLALMDAGVPIKKHVAGAAMGLMLEQNPKSQIQNPKYRVLTDIQGPEDHHGDMDFKVAGTRDGITAVQLDVKIEGLTIQIIRDTLTQALRSRMQILDTMYSIIPEPRPELSRWAPRVTVIKINPEKIGALIGPGGKVINDIIAQTGAEIDIEDDGTVFVTSNDEDAMKKALSLVKQVTRELKPGELLEGKVTRILDFGAMVEVGPKQDGLIHISELAPWHVEKVTDILNLGDVVPVRVKNIDEQGRINLSLKDVPGRYTEEEIERGRKERARMPRGPLGSRGERPRRTH